jgi:hypothetical protein
VVTDDGERTLWEHEDARGAKAFLALTRADRFNPGYELVVDAADPEYTANELRVDDLQRAHLAGLWVALLEQADAAGLEWAREAVEREVARRAGHGYEEARG